MWIVTIRLGMTSTRFSPRLSYLTGKHTDPTIGCPISLIKTLNSSMGEKSPISNGSFESDGPTSLQQL